MSSVDTTAPTQPPLLQFWLRLYCHGSQWWTLLREGRSSPAHLDLTRRSRSSNELLRHLSLQLDSAVCVGRMPRVRIRLPPVCFRGICTVGKHDATAERNRSAGQQAQSMAKFLQRQATVRGMMVQIMVLHYCISATRPLEVIQFIIPGTPSPGGESASEYYLVNWLPEQCFGDVAEYIGRHGSIENSAINDGNGSCMPSG